MTQKAMWMLAVGTSLALAQVPIAPGRAQAPVAPGQVQAIRTLRPNLVHGQILGRGILYTLNYEHYFSPRIGAGVGLMAIGSSDATFTLIPVFLSLNPVGNIHSLYLSPGAVFVAAGSPSQGDFTSTVLGAVEIGYQYQSATGFMIRPGFDILFGDGGFLIWPGFSIGASF
jgi:hypothetical protein